MTELERDIEKKLRQRIEAMGGRCIKWVSPSSGGVPDRIVLLPGGRIYFVETKRPKGGKLSALQKKWHKWLTLLGFHCCTIWTFEELDSFIAEIQITKGGTP